MHSTRRHSGAIECGLQFHFWPHPELTNVAVTAPGGIPRELPKRHSRPQLQFLIPEDKNNCSTEMGPFGVNLGHDCIANGIVIVQGKKVYTTTMAPPPLSVCCPTPRSQSNKGYGEYHVLGKTRQKGIHHRSGKGIYHRGLRP